MKTKDFVLNCTSRQYVLLLQLVELRIEDLSSSLELLDIDFKSNKVYNEYQDIYFKLKENL